jgi:triosephosphate isomerase
MPAPRALAGVSLKLYFDHHETVAWCRRVAELAAGHPAVMSGAVELVVIPSLPSVPAAVAAFAGTPVAVGAQDLFWEDRGPFTGESSGLQLAQLGARYVEIGHAERRALFGETDATVAKKVAAALRNGLVPFLCIGEPERGDVEAAAEYAVAQLSASLAAAVEAGLTGELVVAYEPVWAIGQAEAASAEHVQFVARRLAAAAQASPAVTDRRVIYGGSAGPGVLTALGADVDGLFLGRFAHDPAALAAVLDEAAQAAAQAAAPAAPFEPAAPTEDA